MLARSTNSGVFRKILSIDIIIWGLEREVFTALLKRLSQIFLNIDLMGV